jgi:hypothetical protein
VNSNNIAKPWAYDKYAFCFHSNSISAAITLVVGLYLTMISFIEIGKSTIMNPQSVEVKQTMSSI